MGKLITTSKPLILQSKFLCFSLLYLFTFLFLALYAIFSQSKCFDPIQTSLFSYPSSYGEHKYAISTTRSTCSSPVIFSDYWDVLKEIKRFRKNSSSPTRIMRYMQGNAESFGGNLSTILRFSYFDHQNDSKEVPCGFFKKFPINNSDRLAMEKCESVVVVSAIFNDHDKIRQPRGMGSKTLENVCFFMFIDDITLKGLEHHGMVSIKSSEYKIGVWRIVKVSKEDLYQIPAMNGVIPKYLVHRLFPNSHFSIWIDAKLQLMVDPLLLIHSLVISENVDMAISKHPYYVHTMEESMATARWKKWWDVNALKMQMETYCENGLQPWSPSKLPYASDVPDSALILRKHGLSSNLFSCLMFNELEAFNPRDQLAFAFVRDHMNPKVKLNMFEVEVFEQVTIEYRHNLKPSDGSTVKKLSRTVKTKRAEPDLLFGAFQNLMFFTALCCDSPRDIHFDFISALDFNVQNLLLRIKGCKGFQAFYVSFDFGKFGYWMFDMASPIHHTRIEMKVMRMAGTSDRLPCLDVFPGAANCFVPSILEQPE
ncbi:alkaline ceramidase TOD1-like [Gastrolobium bilobum]|uniref:alkaline ceramidase TOD1-like n=1 Tax=Gastrolobium bilobum TaxID=150636 RepID=UPI002AB10447|nr:alkaline ceramidase TOD1-like [Gastrolobium bilobum]